MSKKANSVAIGMFVLGALILAITVIIYFGSFKLFSKNKTFILYFDESVNGLNVGAPVKFKGVPVGRVVKIYIRFNEADESDHIPVIIEIDTLLANSLGVTRDLDDESSVVKRIDSGVRARLSSESVITGLLFIEINLFENAPPPVYVQEKPIYQEIPTIPSTQDNLKTSGSELIARLSKIDTEAISSNLVHTLKRADVALEKIDFAKINSSLIEAAESTHEWMSSPKAVKAVETFNQALVEFQDLVVKLESETDPFLAKAEETNEALQMALQEVEGAALQLHHTLSPESNFRQQFEDALSDVADAAEAIQLFVEFIERNPNALITGKKPPES